MAKGRRLKCSTTERKAKSVFRPKQIIFESSSSEGHNNWRYDLTIDKNAAIKSDENMK